MGGSADSLSSVYLHEGQHLKGGDHIPKGGYIEVVKVLSEGLDVRLDHIVQNVQYSTNGVKVNTNQGLFEADFAVCPVPLGVLKKQSIQFDPPLPQWKQNGKYFIGNNHYSFKSVLRQN